MKIFQIKIEKDAKRREKDAKKTQRRCGNFQKAVNFLDISHPLLQNRFINNQNSINNLQFHFHSCPIKLPILTIKSNLTGGIIALCIINESISALSS